MKEIRIFLQMRGKPIRTIEELREHASEELLAFYKDGRLKKWLSVGREHADECARLEQISPSGDDSQLLRDVCAALGIDHAVIVESIYAEAAALENAGGETDSQNVFKRYKDAAELGHAGAQLRVGRGYDEGVGVEQDAAEAVN